jgi:cell division protein FtsI/penicillin-binding protein 2
LLCFGQCVSILHAQTDNLHEQAAAALLRQRFSTHDLSYLLLDDQGRVIAQNWQHADKEIPVGSLIKPFIAVAYGRTHASFPSYHCSGKKTCWLPRGHGTLGIREAIAYSCNSYFHQLYLHAEPGFATGSLRQLGLEAFPDGHSGRASPRALIEAYSELARQPRDKMTSAVLDGMELSARMGTGKAAGVAMAGEVVLAKTGTAPCTHSPKAPGDGFAVVMVPADHPRMSLLVRVHGKPGSFAAGVAGQMLAAVEANGSAQ